MSNNKIQAPVEVWQPVELQAQKTVALPVATMTDLGTVKLYTNPYSGLDPIVPLVYDPTDIINTGRIRARGLIHADGLVFSSKTDQATVTNGDINFVTDNVIKLTGKNLKFTSPTINLKASRVDLFSSPITIPVDTIFDATSKKITFSGNSIYFNLSNFNIESTGKIEFLAKSSGEALVLKNSGSGYIHIEDLYYKGTAIYTPDKLGLFDQTTSKTTLKNISVILEVEDSLLTNSQNPVFISSDGKNSISWPCFAQITSSDMAAQSPFNYVSKLDTNKTYVYSSVVINDELIQTSGYYNNIVTQWNLIRQVTVPALLPMLGSFISTGAGVSKLIAQYDTNKTTYPSSYSPGNSELYLQGYSSVITSESPPRFSYPELGYFNSQTPNKDNTSFKLNSSGTYVFTLGGSVTVDYTLFVPESCFFYKTGLSDIYTSVGQSYTDLTQKISGYDIYRLKITAVIIPKSKYLTGHPGYTPSATDPETLSIKALDLFNKQPYLDTTVVNYSLGGNLTSPDNFYKDILFSTTVTPTTFFNNPFAIKKELVFYPTILNNLNIFNLSEQFSITVTESSYVLFFVEVIPYDPNKSNIIGFSMQPNPYYHIDVQKVG